MSNKNNQQVNKVPRMTGPRRGVVAATWDL